MSVSGIAAQATDTSGPRRRSLCRWMARAASSFPVPVSPWIKTVGVARSHCRNEIADRSHLRAGENEIAESLDRGLVTLRGGDDLLREESSQQHQQALRSERVSGGSRRLPPSWRPPPSGWSRRQSS